MGVQKKRSQEKSGKGVAQATGNARDFLQKVTIIERGCTGSKIDIQLNYRRLLRALIENYLIIQGRKDESN
jgi:hypothetical protein